MFVCCVGRTVLWVELYRREKMHIMTRYGNVYVHVHASTHMYSSVV